MLAYKYNSGFNIAAKNVGRSNEFDAYWIEHMNSSGHLAVLLSEIII